MKKIPGLVIIAVVAVAAVAGGYAWKKNGRPLPDREIQPKRGTIAIEFRQTGSVSPRNRLEIKPPLSGRLDDILVVEGQKVKKGAIIAWMSSMDRATLLDAARAQGEKELQQWEDTYKPTPIVSPLDGFIIARSREPGQSVTTSDVVLVMADTLIIEANVDETDLRHIALGQEVDIFLDAYPDKKLQGTVEHIAFESKVVSNVTLYTIKIRPLATNADFRAGMTATVIITAARKENALLLPGDAVSARDGKSFVLLKNGRNKPRPRKIETGISDGRQLEILEGLSEEDTVVYPRKKNLEENRERRQSGSPLMGGMGTRRR